MSEAVCSLFDTLSPDVPVAFWKGEYIYPEKFQQHVYAIAETLPDKKYAVNLCEDRYLFLVAFAACLLKAQASLLPPSRAENEIERLFELYADAYCLVDNEADVRCQEKCVIQLDNINIVTQPECNFTNDAVAAIVFTSGTTGSSKPHKKRWKDLVMSTSKLKQGLGLKAKGFDTIVATVPPQHMYGLEMSIVYPLVNKACMHAGRPFFPQDIKDDINDVQSPCVLVTTPIHLSACNDAEIEWPEIKSIISAASKLSVEVATEAESKMKTRVQEVYGCTEVGAIATRRTTVEKKWMLLEGYRVIKKADSAFLNIPGAEEQIELPDKIDVIDQDSFVLIGRGSDIVKIGGKRESLSNITNVLKNISGVEDGLIFKPDTSGSTQPRLAAIVVAPGLSEAVILQELKKNIDQVFLPRKIIKVNHLPYSDTGKLTLDSLNAEFSNHTTKRNQQIAAKRGYGS